MTSRENEEILRELNYLYDFTDEIDSECDDYIKELPKDLEYREELIANLKTLQSIATDIGAIIEILREKIEDKDDKGVKP